MFNFYGQKANNLVKSTISIKNSIFEKDFENFDDEFWLEYPICGFELKYLIKSFGMSQAQFAQGFGKIVLNEYEQLRKFESTRKTDYKNQRKLKQRYVRYYIPDDVGFSRNYTIQRIKKGWT